ncbi:MAG: pyruvate dehydrogenase (acetyl-transferring) E1 component subunit alpha, partial [Brachybacterium sp.]|nr:pyruvate dehydrogenase (acetyl-transferring) E1 component subunit alpha [Brachybacterium sp.]
TSDDPSRYRDEKELERWERRCPLGRLERHLEQLGADLEELHGEAERRSQEATTAMQEAVAALASPTPESMFENVLSTEHPGLIRQREQFRAFTASLAPEQAEGSPA